MRFINILLAILVSLLCGALVLEGGLRLMGRGPTATINRFDPLTGWSKKPGAVGKRKTPEFNVKYEVNELGLRDSDTTSYAKPAGTFRVLCLGDSFTLGYTVEAHDLFLEQLGRAWSAEGRKVDVVNAGTEGWATDQEVEWFLNEGVKFEPDLVLIFPYENDLFWNGQTQYARFPKPRFGVDGKLDSGKLVDPGPLPWRERTALGLLLKKSAIPGGTMEIPFEDTKFSLSSGKPDDKPVARLPGKLPREWAALMVNPPDFMQDAAARTSAALGVLRDQCAKTGAKLVMVPIPNKAAVQKGAEEALRSVVCLRKELWHPNQALRTFLDAAHALGIKALDPTQALRDAASAEAGEPAPELYFAIDWHLNPRGNLELANFLHRELDVANVGLPSASGTLATLAPDAAKPPASRTWMLVFAGLWVALTALYYGNYADEPKWQPPLKVFAMLSAVFLIVFGAKLGMSLLPAAIAPKLMVLLVLVILGFVGWKLGRRIATIAELSKAFVLRGHWYLMPLLVVLLSIGSLLVVAASSPLIAPFIYTLF
ncbi:MAG TPA: DUF5989 family protein [Planctomycetota bacterium]|nr:DUF5989 family protein [Planctomycetota bacterium]